MARTTRAKLGVRSRGKTTVGSVEEKEARERALRLAKVSLETETTVGRPDAPWRVLVYGESGVGKTTFLSRCPSVFFLAVEQGANQTHVLQWRNAISSMDELEEALDVLRYSRHDYKAVALETLDAVETLMRERVETRLLESAKKPRQGDKPAPTTIAEWNEAEYGAGYEALLDEWVSLTARLDVLRDERGMAVLASAHGKVETVPTLDSTEDFKRYAPQISGRKCMEAVKGWFDYVLFLKTEVHVSREGRKVMAASGGRYMYASQQATHDAKCRGLLVWPDKLPLDPDAGWETFERVARFVLGHGDGSVASRLAAALGALPADRAESARKVYSDAFGRRDYVTCLVLLDQAEEEGRVRAQRTREAGTNGATKTEATTGDENAKGQGT